MTSQADTITAPPLDRRAAIAWAGALAAALGGAQLFGVSLLPASAVAAPGYGRDPDLLEPAVPWPRLLNDQQRSSIRLIADYILPREGSAPSASEVGVHDLIDEWVSAPYPEHLADRALVFEGLDWLDSWARIGGASAFAFTDAGLQARLLAKISQRDSDLPTGAFFKRLRRLILGGYYTTEAGFADIGYVGNIPLKAYPAASPAALAALERAYARLGLRDLVSGQTATFTNAQSERDARHIMGRSI